jgi:hypothetical protein
MWTLPGNSTEACPRNDILGYFVYIYDKVRRGGYEEVLGIDSSSMCVHGSFASTDSGPE